MDLLVDVFLLPAGQIRHSTYAAGTVAPQLGEFNQSVFVIPYTALILFFPVMLFYASAEVVQGLAALLRIALSGSDQPW